MANALQGAKFVLEHKTKNYRYETTIDEKLTLHSLPEGEYTYSLSKRGYETNEGTIYVDQAGKFNLKLALNKKTTTNKKSSTKKADDKK